MSFWRYNRVECLQSFKMCTVLPRNLAFRSLLRNHNLKSQLILQKSFWSRFRTWSVQGPQKQTSKQTTTKKQAWHLMLHIQLRCFQSTQSRNWETVLRGHFSQDLILVSLHVWRSWGINQASFETPQDYSELNSSLQRFKQMSGQFSPGLFFNNLHMLIIHQKQNKYSVKEVITKNFKLSLKYSKYLINI